MLLHSRSPEKTVPSKMRHCPGDEMHGLNCAVGNIERMLAG